MKHPTMQVLTTAIILGYAALSCASDKSVTVFPAEGNKQCSDYAANNKILQMGNSSCRTSTAASGTLSGPENPRDADTTGESATYAIGSGGTVTSFSASTTPVDYALLKSGNKISVIIYPSGGVTSDANMTVKDAAGNPLPITAISLCYGLGNVAPPPPPLTTIPSCEELNLSGGIDGVAVTCPSTGERSIVYNFELGQPFYNTTNTPMSCVCNGQALIECNPSVAYDPEHPDNGACVKPEADATGLAVTTHIELNNDPYVCSTVAGKRTCYSY
jgi:hypothetical protein